jgi:hypothetical protein
VNKQCDEVRPACKHCIRRGQDCDYSVFRHLRSLNLQNYSTIKKPRRERTASQTSYFGPKSEQNLCKEATIYHAFESNTIRPRSPRMRPAEHLLELRLIHFLISKSSAIQSVFPDGHFIKLCIGNILRLSTEYGYLMDILMGAGANWQRYRNPNDQALVAASHTYALRAIQEFSRQIYHGINENNAKDLFLASVLLPMHTFTSYHYDILKKDNSSKTGDSWLVQWLRQYQGVRAIKAAGWLWLRKSEPISPVLSDFPPVGMIDDQCSGPSFGFLLEGLEEEEITTETRTSYVTPVAYLSLVINHGPLPRGLFGFPTSVFGRFLGLLSERDPRAMTIVGSFLAGICMFRAQLLTDVAEREFNRIVEQLPIEWLAKMRGAQELWNGCLQSYGLEPS